MSNIMTVTGVIILEPLDEEAEGKTDAILRFRLLKEEEDEKTPQHGGFAVRPLKDGEDGENSRGEFSGTGSSAGKADETDSRSEVFENRPLEEGEIEKNSGTEFFEVDLIPEEEDEPSADDRNYQIFRRRQAAEITGRKDPRGGSPGAGGRTFMEDKNRE
jgi:hypothetical protein